MDENNLNNESKNESASNQKKDIQIPNGIYDERIAKEKQKEKRDKLKEDIKNNANNIANFTKNYYSIVKKIFSSDKEANETIKEIFATTGKKHFTFINILILMFVFIPFVNLVKAGLFSIFKSDVEIMGNGNLLFPCFVYFLGLILYLVVVALILFLLEFIFSKRKLKIKDLLNLINIKVILMIFYTFIIILVTLIKPINDEVLYLLSSVLMLISLSTSDALMIRIGRKTGLIRETSNRYMIVINTLLSIAMFIAYYLFLTYL